MINNPSFQEKIQDYLKTSHFNQSNNPNEQELNLSMMQFKQNSQEILLLEKKIEANQCFLNLHIFESVIKPSLKQIQIMIYDENFEQYELSQKKRYQLLLNSYFQEEYLAIYSDDEIFVCKIGSRQVIGINDDKLEFMKLNFSQEIQSIKWYPHSRSHLAILTKSLELQIFDIIENLDDSEINIELILPNNRLTEEHIVDFCFSQTTKNYDLSHFSVFFISNLGFIYIKCPLLLNSTIYEKNLTKDLRRSAKFIQQFQNKINRLDEDDIKDKELNFQLKQILNFIEQYSQNHEHSLDKKILKIKALNQNMNNDMLQGPIIVYQNKLKKQPNQQFYLITKMICVHHVFIVVNQKGNVNIYMSVQNVFPSSNFLQNKRIQNNFENNHFDLIEIDRLKVQCEISSKTSNQQLFQFRKDLVRPVISQDFQRKELFYIFFFNKIYKLNLDQLQDELNSDYDIKYFIQSIREQPNLQLLLDIPCQSSSVDLTEYGYYCSKIINGNIFIIRQTNLNIFPIQFFGFNQIFDKKIQKNQDELIQIVNIMPQDILQNNDVKNIDNFNEYLKNIENAQNYFVNQNQKKFIQIDSIYKKTFFMIKENEEKYSELPQDLNKRIEKIENNQLSIQEKINRINCRILNKDLNQEMYLHFTEQLNQYQNKLDKINQSSQMIIEKFNQNRKQLRKIDSSKQIDIDQNIKDDLIKLFKDRKLIHKKLNNLQKQN